MSGYASMLKSIRGLAERLQALNQEAVRQYTPLVDAILRSNSRDIRHIEHTLDGLLSFCGYEPALQLYKKLCRHYFAIDPAATAEYVHAYRDMWDSEEKEEQRAPVKKHLQQTGAKAKQREARKPCRKKSRTK
jgi:hypothetical protein